MLESRQQQRTAELPSALSLQRWGLEILVPGGKKELTYDFFPCLLLRGLRPAPRLRLRAWAEAYSVFLGAEFPCFRD